MKFKAISLLSLLPRSPVEFYERVTEYAGVRIDTILNVRPKYNAISMEHGISRLFPGRGSEVNKILSEDSLAQIETHVNQRQFELPASAPFGQFHNGDPFLARLCYLVVRMIQPARVVETGVCYGVTSSYLLAAMNKNNYGHLHSIDLPPLGSKGDDYVGWLVPNELKDRWTLRRGTSERLLASVVEELETLDLFIHDSLHTFKNMKQEFDTSWSALNSRGILISDDIEGNDAFLQMVKSHQPEISVIMEQKNKSSLVGAAVKRE
ncbi:MAG TPA: class I SAM-dependent methyltransferase [Candidatus Saccharimonadales bacterium]|jgi:predicted O-methyltransferase YrrM|nr:class I SAM-dependent methyltransferase [Candidatus Saccharimonadales bacterium]